MRCLFLLLLLLIPAAAPAQEAILLRPARVFDGVAPEPHEGWTVLVQGERIVAAGPAVAAPAGARVVDLPGMTLMPGMIEGHSHLFLHPYDEASWDDQGEARPLNATRASASFFSTLRVNPARGRAFTASEEGPSPAPVVVISHGLWVSSFASDACHDIVREPF